MRMCCSLRSALFELAKEMNQFEEEVVDLEQILGIDDGRAALMSMKDEDIKFLPKAKLREGIT